MFFKKIPPTTKIVLLSLFSLNSMRSQQSRKLVSIFTVVSVAEYIGTEEIHQQGRIKDDYEKEYFYA